MRYIYIWYDIYIYIWYDIYMIWYIYIWYDIYIYIYDIYIYMIYIYIYINTDRAPIGWGPTQVEQPGSSRLRDSPYYVHLLQNCGPAFFQRTWLGLFGHWCCKATQLFGSTWGAKLLQYIYFHICVLLSWLSLSIITPCKAYCAGLRRAHVEWPEEGPEKIFNWHGEKNHFEIIKAYVGDTKIALFTGTSLVHCNIFRCD